MMENLLTKREAKRPWKRWKITYADGKQIAAIAKSSTEAIQEGRKTFDHLTQHQVFQRKKEVRKDELPNMDEKDKAFKCQAGHWRNQPRGV